MGNRKIVHTKPDIKTRLAVMKAKSGMLDARQKIIQKKRKKLHDARDVLANMAKKQDARDKILKIRELRKGENPLNGNVRKVGSNIIKKTDRNGKVSLITNKAKQNPHDLNIAVRQQLGLVPQPRPNLKKVVKWSAKETVQNSVVAPVIRKTILNDEYSQPAQIGAGYGYERRSPYRWYRPEMLHPPFASPHFDSRRINGGRGEAWDLYPPENVRISRPPHAYIDLDAVDDEDEDIEMVMSSYKSPPKISNVHSRLDQSPNLVHTHGIFSQPKTKVVVPIGHRIVVSNLQPTVTQDDIRELFEDIGQLLVARLVRPGTAEVIYKNLKDAQKAVDTYHNRQLDGQPMKCLLVNKKSSNNIVPPPKPSKSSSDSTLNMKRSNSNLQSDPNKLIPDLSTIHKVLFQRS